VSFRLLRTQVATCLVACTLTSAAAVGTDEAARVGEVAVAGEAPGLGERAVADAGAGAGAGAGQAGTGEDFARRQYDTALAFMRSGRADEAIKDFQAIADNYPSSSVADQALLQMATYYWERANDAARAKAALDQLLRMYGTGRAAPFAHLLNGRIALASVATGGTEAALASFERARRLFPAPEVTAAAAYYSGEALRSGGRCPDAIAEYATVLVDHPRMAWAGRAEIGVARCFIAQHQPRAAMSHLQRARQYADLPADEMTRASRWLTVLARFYLRGQTDPAFVFGGRALPQAAKSPRDVIAMAVDTSDHLHLLTESAFLTYDAQGRPIQSFQVNEPRGLVVDTEGRAVVIEKNVLRSARGQPITVRPLANAGAGAGAGAGAAASAGAAAAASSASTEPLSDLSAACVLSTGEIILAERHTKRLHRVAADGRYLGALTSLHATRIAANDRDEIVVLDRDSKSIVLIDRQGAIVRRIAARGEGYQFDNVVDLAIDALGHIYALDRGQAAVFIFTNDGKLLTTLHSPETGDGAFREPTAFALDAAGRLYVADSRAHQLVIYQ
jgi:TolA-binding protein